MYSLQEHREEAMVGLGMILILTACLGECRGWADPLGGKGLGEGSEGFRVRAQSLVAGIVGAKAHPGAN